jgi:hypothetical protein
MGINQSNLKKINYEDVQYVIKNTEVYILINTLSEMEQSCLIINTLNIHKESDLINKFITTGNKQVKIIIYGKNCNDDKIYTKYNQLYSLGFYNIYLYTGGLFEWLILQDIFGENDFPTTSKENDFLKYKANKVLSIKLLEY